jgi:peptide chain release factor subunit 1
MGIFDTGYTDETMRINELLERSKEVLTEQAVVQERKIMERFLGEVARGGLVASGYESVKAALDEGNVSRLLVSDAAEYSNVRYKCSACGTELSAIEKGAARRDKHECGGKLDQIGVKDAVDELIEEADRQGVETVFVSAESQYGKEFHEGFGGIGAMLRHR